MTGQVFGGAVDDNVRAVLQRAQVQGGGESAVHHAHQLVGAGNLDDPGKIGHTQIRVARALEEDHAGGGPDSGGKSLGTVVLDQRRLDAPTGQQGLGKFAGLVETVAAKDEMIAPREQRQQGGADGRHAAGKQQGALAAIQRSQLALGRRLGRVAIAPVLAAAVRRAAFGFLLHVGQDFSRIAKGVRGRPGNGRRQGVLRLVPEFPGMHSLGRVVFFHQRSPNPQQIWINLGCPGVDKKDLSNVG